MRRAAGRLRRGIALIDFITGMVIFSAALGAFVTLTRSKFDAIRSTDLRGRALSAVEERLDRLRLEGLKRWTPGQVDPDGFQVVEEFGAPAGFPGGQGRVEVRALRLQANLADHGLYEARVRLLWQGVPGDPQSLTSISLSTVCTRPEAR